MPRGAKRLALTSGVVLALALGTYAALNEPRPHGTKGPEADALARTVADAANVAAWERTAAVRFTFGGIRRYLWDRARGCVRLRWDEEDVRFRLGSPALIVLHNGLPLHAGDAEHLRQRAERFFAHDSYWLNPIARFFDRSATRELVAQRSGARALLVRYGEGSVLQGDAYLFELGRDGLPTAFAMWASTLPFGGVRASFERWQTLRTGAKVATLHRMTARWVALSEVEGASTLRELEPGEDPFAALAP